MAKSPPASAARRATSPESQSYNLVFRVVSALVMAPLAIGAAVLGGWAFTLFWTLAALAVWWEWTHLVTGSTPRLPLVIGIVALVAASALAQTGRFSFAIGVVAVGVSVTTVVAPLNRAGWVAAGLIYASVLLVSPLVLRHNAQWGFLAILFLFAVVWTTDILGYFVGRAVGGPKLWPAISPNKTWSGALAGACGAVAVGFGLASRGNLGAAFPLAAVALLLSVVAQAGDLFESAVKRRFHAKDASHIIPGHGGVMDRVDGFLVAALVGAILGVLRAGADAAGRGLLLW